MRFLNSALFAFCIFAIWWVYTYAPTMENFPSWLTPMIIGLCIGVFGQTLNQFFTDVSDIRRALEKDNGR